MKQKRQTIKSRSMSNFSNFITNYSRGNVVVTKCVKWDLKDIIERKGGKPNEALVQGSEGEFITVAKYLFVVGDQFKSGDSK